MDISRRGQLVMAVVQHTVNCNYDRAVQVLGEIAATSTRRQMYGACCALAEAGRQILVRLYGHASPEGLWALAAPDPDDDCAQHPAHLFSLRFIAAFANRDMPTCEALYLAAANASGEDYFHSLTALIGDVGHLARVALEELAADSEQPAPHPR
ncbi:hypothetical protein [Streptomyces rhizosphaerihabitans]|uniref:hypothetical protein n=1 Tax=Streptomyces rhizosphaerihabitans TaxID=1266770 RepID=UPI0021C0F6EF|nr:hypothetical protein [Streptomyces rhizosphaerihabitans]MCT9003505.1 hypothetical protein [Streptomyces rhizosphaerihabitans]